MMVSHLDFGSSPVWPWRSPGEYEAGKEGAQRYEMLTDHRIVVFDVYVVEVFLQVFATYSDRLVPNCELSGELTNM